MQGARGRAACSCIPGAGRSYEDPRNYSSSIVFSTATVAPWTSLSAKRPTAGAANCTA
jgi:hypothetical protein